MTDELQNMGIVELKELAKAEGVKYWSTMKKSELMAAIRKVRSPDGLMSFNEIIEPFQNAITEMGNYIEQRKKQNLGVYSFIARKKEMETLLRNLTRIK